MLRRKIARKVIGFLLVNCFGICLITGWISYQNGKSILQESSFNQLTAIREIKSNQMRFYLNFISSQLETLSESRMTIDAMKEYKAAFAELSNQETLAQTGTDPIEKDAVLHGYYKNQFLPKLKEESHETHRLESVFPQSETAIYLQHHYIGANPAPMGQKDQLDKSNDGSKYSQVHEEYHPLFRSYRNKFGYHDIFLIDDKTGDIVYSVLKEVDYATSLLTGPFKQSSIADVFQKTLKHKNPNEVKFTDFKYYLPSYGAPAAFLGSPIYDNKKRIGILVFQLPVKPINEIMTGGGNWLKDGLGQTGETYLVGPDGLMRSMSRFLIEDREAYFNELRNLSYSEREIQKLDKYNTSILLQSVETPAAKRAMMGNTETAIIKDYRGIPVLSSYAPIQVGDMQWALISEIDAAEAFAPISVLSQSLGISTIVIALAVGLISILVASRFIKPIKALAGAAETVRSGDTTIKLHVPSRDEIGQLTHNFNNMVVSLHEQRTAIEKQILENNKLLLNVLPEPIAERLKDGESQIADTYPDASIMFTDIVGFTAWSKGKPAIEVLTMLDAFVRLFDEKAKALGVEKIKTMGDSYMAVCGLPIPNKNHPQIMADLALYILETIKVFNRKNNTEFKMRIGLHCGPVVAGVIGTSKFVYDLWGESVNMASRMESTGIPNQIQISEAFYEATKKDYSIVFRGDIAVKGAGTVKTYLLQNKIG